MYDNLELHSRGYLPHWDAGPRPQFLTWHEHDAIPAHVLHQMNLELTNLPTNERAKRLAKTIERYCDEGHGACILGKPMAARAAQEAIFACDGLICNLHAWVVMPNHMHVLATPCEGVSLAEVVKRLKGRSAFEVNRAVGRRGQLWQVDYFDRLIRDDEHFTGVAHYIEWNPVKAKLCIDPKHWAWSSRNPYALAALQNKRTEVRDPCAG